LNSFRAAVAFAERQAAAGREPAAASLADSTLALAAECAGR